MSPSAASGKQTHSEAVELHDGQRDISTLFVCVKDDECLCVPLYIFHQYTPILTFLLSVSSLFLLTTFKENNKTH